jgi:membrane protease YdiL (CAAX protease family)
MEFINCSLIIFFIIKFITYEKKLNKWIDKIHWFIDKLLNTVRLSFKIMKINPLSIYFVAFCIGIYQTWICFTDDSFENQIVRSLILISTLGICSVMTNRCVNQYHGLGVYDGSIGLETLVNNCLVSPLIEEYLCRHAIKNDLMNLGFGQGYVMHITSILFGLGHLSNYFGNVNILLVNGRILFIKVILQIIHATVLGYIFFSTFSMLHCILLHSYYNVLVMLLGKLYTKMMLIHNNENETMNMLVAVPMRRHSYSFQGQSDPGYQSIRVSKELYDRHNESMNRLRSSIY